VPGLLISSVQRLCQIHERDELAAIAVSIHATRILGQLENSIVAEFTGVLSAAQQLAEGGDCYGKLQFLHLFYSLGVRMFAALMDISLA